MTDVIADPRTTFLESDPREAFLAQSDFTPDEQNQIRAIDQPTHSVLKASLALGGLYLLYRLYIKRKLKESNAKTLEELKAVAAKSWQVFVPWWVGIASTQLMTGYAKGIQEVASGTVDQELLYDIAQSYSAQLGESINDVSREAMTAGFQAQVNRKVPAVIAARRVGEAFGVPPRTMNSLVSVWTRDEGKQMHARVVVSVKDKQADVIIESANQHRARQIGETEMFTVQHQAKQMLWMYGMEHGTIPRSATRTWVTAKDERVCTSCGPMDKVEAPLGEQFKTSTGDIWAPPFHPSCRCDTILNFNMSDSLRREMDELTSDEPVSKAQGTDPYDRDKRGYFAARESRPTKVKLKVDDPFIKDLERQLENYLATKKTEEQVKPEAKAAPSKMPVSTYGQTSEAPRTGGPSVMSVSRMNVSSLPASMSPSIMGQSVMTPSSYRPSQMVPSQMAPSSSPTPTPRTPPTPKPAGNGDKGEPLGDWELFPNGTRFMKFYIPDENNERNSAGHIEVTANDIYQLDDTHGNFVINGQIDDYWRNFKTEFSATLDQDDVEIYLQSPNAPADKNFYTIIVPADVHRKLLNQAVAGDFKGEKTILEGMDDNGKDVHFSFDNDYIAGKEGLGLIELVSDHMPVVMVMSHRRTGTTEIYEGKQGYGTNPGTWEYSDRQDFSDEHGAYRNIYITPVGLDT